MPSSADRHRLFTLSRPHAPSGDSGSAFTHGEPAECLNGRLNDEWDLPTATPGKYQAYRRMALFLLKHPVLLSQSPVALLFFVGGRLGDL